MGVFSSHSVSDKPALCTHRCHCWLQVEVERTQISGNLDAPEGGFDAIMQAIACRVSVRDRNRRIWFLVGTLRYIFYMLTLRVVRTELMCRCIKKFGEKTEN